MNPYYEAALLLEKEGWCQHDPINRKGERCWLGALSHVVGDAVLMQNLFLPQLRRFMKVQSLSDWNDKEGRTVQEVTEALRWMGDIIEKGKKNVP